MKKIPVLITTFIIFSLVFIRCDKNENTISDRSYEVPEINELPHLIKGYELYSWEENDNWYYTLIEGTNRTKTFEEISAENNILEGNGIKVSTESLSELKNIISKLPEDELVFWLGEDWIKLAWGDKHDNIKLPDEEIQNELLKFCNDVKVRLSIVE